jgi:2-polyprenyl-3-methyl-5-hydroxy-6-metoxy-1,4-benzoquinol methylase
MRCGGCKSEFLDPQPSEEWLAHEYDGYFAMRQGRSACPKRRLIELVLSKLGSIKAESEILEIGGGEGHLVRAILERHADVKVTLVEPQADAALYPSDRVSVQPMLVESWMSEAVSKKYDIIVAMDLIEHLRQPLSVMKELIAQRLKPGGRILVTTPNAGSILKKIMGSYWPHYKVEHLTYPTKQSLSILARDASLDIVELNSLAKPLEVDYLITVLRHFGPPATRRLGAMLNTICPEIVRNWHVRIPSGELLFVATKRS